MSSDPNCFELMMEEHRNIKRMLGVIRQYCYMVLKDEAVDYNDFLLLIDFVRNYADKHHHGKEEELLFIRMLEELGPAAEKVVKNGMLVEHDLGRLHMQELEEAVQKVNGGNDEARLDVIANAVSYTHLLHRHIKKEDEVLYQFAQKKLSPAALEGLEEACRRYEVEAAERGTQQKYLNLLNEFEAKIKTS